MATRALDLGEQTASVPREIERWNIHHRLQHLGLFISVSILIVTGFSMKFPDAPPAMLTMRLLGGIRNTLYVHLAAAVMMVATGLYHIGYLVWYVRRHGPTWDMLPRFQDFKDAFHHGLYLLGIRDDRPRFGRYSYLEKFEYLAVFWGFIFMGGSGLVLWFPEVAAYALPRWAISALRVVHSNEAFIALLSLAYGHFFFVHFDPEVFPGSKVWLTGKMSVARMWHEHPLEAEALGLLHVPPEPPRRWFGLSPAAFVWVQILLYAAISIIVLLWVLPELLR